MARPVLCNFSLDGRRGSNVYIALNMPRVLHFSAIHFVGNSESRESLKKL